MNSHDARRKVRYFGLSVEMETDGSSTTATRKRKSMCAKWKGKVLFMEVRKQIRLT